MRVFIDFDGTIVEQDHAYDDLETPLRFKPGASEGLRALKAAGHDLVLWSARSNPDIRADGVGKKRHAQMLVFVAKHLQGVFSSVDESKPSGADLFLDDRALRLGDDAFGANWSDVARMYGESAPAFEAVEGQAYEAIRARLVSEAQRLDLEVGVIDAQRGLPILRLRAPAPSPGARVCVIVAGQHGDEQAGVLAICKHLQEIVAKARALGVDLRIYPCVNVTAFDLFQRHNVDGEERANSFLEYVVPAGAGGDKTEDELPPGEVPSEVRDFEGASRECRALRADLVRLDLGDPVTTVLDLHQDSLLEAKPRGAFAYVFGERASYAAIMRASGAEPLKSASLENDSWTEEHIPLHTDKGGLVEFYDGSLSDWAWRRGAALSACLEVSTGGDVAPGIEIARRWILGFVAMTAAGASARGGAPPGMLGA